MRQPPDTILAVILLSFIIIIIFPVDPMLDLFFLSLTIIIIIIIFPADPRLALMLLSLFITIPVLMFHGYRPSLHGLELGRHSSEPELRHYAAKFRRQELEIRARELENRRLELDIELQERRIAGLAANTNAVDEVRVKEESEV